MRTRNATKERSADEENVRRVFEPATHTVAVKVKEKWYRFVDQV